MGDLGDDLRRARERAGMSLGSLSAQTKIRERLLHAMERGDFSQLPAGLLTRGYLRAYAKEVGIEPEPIVARYRREFEPAPPPEPPVPAEVEIDDIGATSRRHLWFVAAVLVGATALSYYTNTRSVAASDSLPPIEPASVAGLDAAAPRPIPSSTPPDGAPVAAAVAAATHEANLLRISLTPTRLVWVQANADGRRVLYTTMQPGGQTAIQAAESLVLRVGDAGALEYTINGVRGRPLGGAGEVREVRITHTNRAEFQQQ